MVIRNRPHAVSPFAFEGASHRAAAAELSKALERREPIIVMTGASGSGRTSFWQSLGTRCGPRMIVAAVDTPPRDIEDFLRQVLAALGLLTKRADQSVTAGPGYDTLVIVLERFLSSIRALDARALIVIDAGEHLDPMLFDQMRILTNLKADPSHQPLQILVLGSSELDDLVTRRNAIETHNPVTPRTRARLRINLRDVRLDVAAGLLIAATIVGWTVRDAVALARHQRDLSVNVSATKTISMPPRTTASSRESRASSTYVPMVPVVSADYQDTRIALSPRMSAAPSRPVPPAAAATITPGNLRGVALPELLELSGFLSRKPDVRTLQQLRDEVIRREGASDSTADPAELKSALQQIENDLDTARHLQLAEDGRRLTAASR